tara:strand:+ start:1560 stop:2339 length:780 start_codon:yes stop_codon:yes gene_type:complete
MTTRKAGGVALFGGMVATTLYLGTWQTRRYFWKTQLMEERATALKRPRIELPAVRSGVLESNEAKHAWRVHAVRGVLEHEREVKVGPRSPPKHTAAHKDPLCEKNGFCLVTPLRRTDVSTGEEERVLVHRGWVPKSALDRGAVARPQGEVTLDVVALESETPGRFTPDNDVARRHYYWLDVPTLAAQAAAATTTDNGAVRVEPVLLQVVGASAPKAWPLEKPVAALQDFYVTPEKHAGYAATWYSLALAGAVMSARLLR